MRPRVRSLWGAAPLVAALALGCGASPAQPPEAPSGTLVVVVRTGPERVPFDAKGERIRRANEQLAARLGHSIQIELDGVLLPQSKSGAEDVIARLVEAAAKDIDALAKREPRALPFARATFERLVVRYAPGEAAARAHGWRRLSTAKLDRATKTIDVARGRAELVALDRGDVSGVLSEAFAEAEAERYARALPDALPAAERRAWFAYQDRHGDELDPGVVRGMIMLEGLARRDGDGALAAEARKWLLGVAEELARAYVEPANTASPRGSPFRQAEAAYMGWLTRELPRMTLDERGAVAEHLWVIDLRTSSTAQDRFAAYAFPGVDKMAFAFAAADAWIKAGHPARRGIAPLFVTVVCPVFRETIGGHTQVSEAGRCDRMFYRWALADGAREEALARGVLARHDGPLARAVFHATRGILHQDGYLRFLRRFEDDPALWNEGAAVLREVVYRPDDALLDESRRLWRTRPFARGTVLLWFARHADVSYAPDHEWPSMLQGTLADEGALASYLALGHDAFTALPVAWPALARSGARMRLVANAAHALLQADPRGVTGALSGVAHALCEDKSTREIAELRAFAEAELPKHPGSGLSEVVEATECKP